MVVDRMGSDLAYIPFGDYIPSFEASSHSPFVEAATSQVLHYILDQSVMTLSRDHGDTKEEEMGLTSSEWSEGIVFT